MGEIGFYSGIGNEFYKWYHEKIKGNKKEIRKIVEKEPETTIRVYGIFKDEEVRDLFVKIYKFHPDYYHAAYFMLRDMNIEKSSVESRIQKNLNGEMMIERKLPKSVHICGNAQSTGNFWEENEWDNIIKLYEDNSFS